MTPSPAWFQTLWGRTRGQWRTPVLALFLAITAAAQTKFLTLEISANVPNLNPSLLQLTDNKLPQSILYCRPHQAPSVTVLVLNLATTPINSTPWKETVETLRRFESSEYVYLYAFTAAGALLPIHPLPEPDAESVPPTAPWVDRALAQIESMGRLIQPGHAATATNLAPFAFQDIAARMAPFPGRKSLICAGCLFSKVPREKAQQFGGPLIQAGVAVYEVEGFPQFGAIVSNVSEDGADLFPGALGGISGRTGGRAYAHGEIVHALTDAIQDGRASYRIAWLPSDANWNGKPHKLRLTSTRRDIHLLAPTWYTADRLEDVAREWHAPIPAVALASPFDQTDIAVQAAPPRHEEGALRIDVRIEPAGILLLPANGRYTGSLVLQAFCYTADSRRFACTEPLRLKLDLTPQQHDAVLQGGLHVPVDVTTPEAFTRIRIIVHDENIQATGSITVPFSGKP